MKKIVCIILCLTLCLSASAVFGKVIPDDTLYYPDNVQQLLAEYRNGKHGDELYQLTVWSTFRGTTTAFITVTGCAATLVVSEPGSRQLRTRELTSEEYSSLVTFMEEKHVDDLPAWDTGHITDGVIYSLTHISKDGVSYVSMNNPGSYDYKPDEPKFEEWYKAYVETYGDDSAYVGIVELFERFMDSGDFQLSDIISSTETSDAVVRVNGEAINFYEKTKVNNGRLQVWFNFLRPMSARNLIVYSTNITFVIRGKKILMLLAGTDYMIELDCSGFENAEALEADLSGGDMFQKEYCRIIPLDTVIIDGFYPLRAICEAFDAEVTWNAEENTVDVTIDNSGVEDMSIAEEWKIENIMMKQKLSGV